MTTPEDVLISGERHLIIHGQFGNMEVKINQLEQKIKDAGASGLLPFLNELEAEFYYLKNVYPSLDGEVTPVAFQLPGTPAPINGLEVAKAASDAAIRNGLRDMKTLVNAAYLSYTHEGAIECHLKAMFDQAWLETAAEANLDLLDDIPL